MSEAVSAAPAELFTMSGALRRARRSTHSAVLKTVRDRKKPAKAVKSPDERFTARAA